MNRHYADEVETDEGDRILDSGRQRFDKRHVDQPRRSPIRRKDKWHQEEDMKPKSKRKHKKIQHKIKYDWQGE